MGYANFALDMYFRKTDVLSKGQSMSVCIAWHKLKIIEKSQCFTLPTEDLEWGEGVQGRAQLKNKRF